MNFKEENQKKVAEIETILRQYLPAAKGEQAVIMEAMEYSLMAGGKRLRPMLMQETYRMFGGEETLIEPFMAAMERYTPILWCTMICRRWTMTSTAGDARPPISSMGRTWESSPGTLF